jgi:RimJ/RimL family protein N-acetyltransferase
MAVEVVPLTTERLLLRQWRDSDLAPFARLNADPKVMEWFANPLTAEESAEMARRCQTMISHFGWGLWAVEVPDVAGFIGFVGLALTVMPVPFSPFIEVGWRLDKRYWGNGYAPEGARASLAYAFDTLGQSEILSLTTAGNLKSRRVMEKIGLHRDPADDFDHPRLAAGHPIRPHVLYRITAAEWREHSTKALT